MKTWLFAMSLFAACGPAVATQEAATTPGIVAAAPSDGTGSGSDEQVCTDEKVMGSMMSHRVCRSKADAETDRINLANKADAGGVRPGGHPNN
jgi:hypothetical protein